MDDVFNRLVDEHDLLLKVLDPQNIPPQTQTDTAVANLVIKENLEKWERVQQLQTTLSSKLEELWNKETDNTKCLDIAKSDVEKLKKIITDLSESLKTSEVAQKELSVKIEQTNRTSLELFKTRLVTNPKEKFMDQLLANITKIKWSHSGNESDSALKGTVSSTSQKPKKFHVNTNQKSAEVVCRELWSLLTEGESFLK